VTPRRFRTTDAGRRNDEECEKKRRLHWLDTQVLYVVFAAVKA